MTFSVLLSVYKKEKPEYLQRAIKSIYEEQSLKPSQIVLVEDGELTSELYNIIDEIKKQLGEVLYIVKLSQNVGLAEALNEGLKYCKYELVARMDTDDIALPQRFEKQIPFMLENENLVVCGSYIGEFYNENEEIDKIIKLPLNNEEMLKFIKLRTPIAHPSSVLRKEKILEVGGYPKEFRIGQDIALWSVLLAKNYELANIPEVLLKLRINNSFYSRRSFEAFKSYIKVLKLQYKLGLINEYIYVRNIILRFILRMSPTSLKKIAYKILRK